MDPSAFFLTRREAGTEPGAGGQTSRGVGAIERQRGRVGVLIFVFSVLARTARAPWTLAQRLLLDWLQD